MTDPRPQLQDPAEELFRQVNPSFAPDGVPTSQVFTATKKDNGLLSLDRGSKTTAQHSFDRFCAMGHSSVFVVVVTISDFAEVTDDDGKTTSPRIPVYDDPKPPSDPENDAHAEADFRNVSKGVAKNRAKLLLAAVRRRHP